jgi:hypothetical protein
MLNNRIEIVGGGSGPAAGALALQDLFQLLSYFLVLHEISAIRSRQANIDSFDEVSIVLQIEAQNLLHEFVRIQPSLGRNLC